MTTKNDSSEPTFELEAIAVKEGHLIKNLKRRFFKLSGDSSDPSRRSLLLRYGPVKERATKVVDLVGAKVVDRTCSLGNFTSEHICEIILDQKRNGQLSFVMCFDSPSVCLEWRNCIHTFNSAGSSAAETRDFLSMIQDGLDAGKVPPRPLAALRNLCVRNIAFRSAVASVDTSVATVIALLPNDDADIQLCAITIVSACCDCPDRTQAFHSAGALKALLQCTVPSASGADRRNSEAALQAVAQMCSMSSSCQDALKDAAGLNLFLKVMSLMKTKRQDSILLKRMASSKFPVPYANTVIKYGMICKEGHVRKSLKNRYFELKVGENFEPLLTVYNTQEDSEKGVCKYRVNLTAAVILLAKNVRTGYSPGCCKRIYLQSQPLIPHAKLTLCFESLEEAQQWSDAIHWAQEARAILDSADAAAAAALEVPIPREESQTRTLAAIDSLPELLPDLDNVADLAPPPPRVRAQVPLPPVDPPPHPPPPSQLSSPPAAQLPPPPVATAAATWKSGLAPGFVMLDISHLDLPALSQIEENASNI